MGDSPLRPVASRHRRPAGSLRLLCDGYGARFPPAPGLHPGQPVASCRRSAAGGPTHQGSLDSPLTRVYFGSGDSDCYVDNSSRASTTAAPSSGWMEISAAASCTPRATMTAAPGIRTGLRRPGRLANAGHGVVPRVTTSSVYLRPFSSRRSITKPARRMRSC